MSSSTTRKIARKGRRARCSAHLSAYLVGHPNVVMPEVALRFLKFGHRQVDLEKFMAEHARAAAAFVVPEHIKAQGRAMFRNFETTRLHFKSIMAGIAEKKRQRAARKIMRRAA